MRLPCRILGATLVALVLAAPAQPRADGPVRASFTWPADGTVTSPFGRRAGGFHLGIDIGALRSLVVRAAAPGRVTLVGQPAGFEGYGTIVAVDLGGG